ncbi:guanine deaminase [Desertifilum sp. FACHB-1129]|uniref:Guanine deaminase n=2 Tax=Desertifilum tharense IPPAS B-1220 TaxID=1781255 RepID=A0A1E5QIA6_9CYAN|nr:MULTISPECIES: guanine deaminase [Desertifilum]MDA0211847.1 guanine deaminase [Cyanobacteria bacterium FC1]MBD2314886.1 guanine deaminase [Desertifilum sp. FACHB-1129]MBD2320413.1 guanine deaminase [Desertifilum sp. FACHB-866]MBD2330541.1 guanine deaminase [Desertifilum sp. FACHB-868]OEJ74351.1 guanine deaminase [Desertifilum tharense IPPAS B-1220]
MSQSYSLKGFRAAFLDFTDDPFYTTETESVRYLPDGLLVVEQGKVKELGEYQTLQAKYSQIEIIDYSGYLISPGFIDLHLHFPQTEMIAAYGEQLLEWLNKYTFPTERKFQDKTYAQQVASLFLDELLRNGTTTAVVFTAVFPESVDAFFTEAQRRNLRAIAGKVMMDRHAPDYLTDTPESAYQDSKELIQKWHNQDRLLYAITPRFAITSSEAQLRLAGKLLAEFPDVYLHTHLSENQNEVAWVKELFPDCNGYLDVYDRLGLVGERSIFAHCVQLTDLEFNRLSAAQSAIAFCPTSNLFLGSGLFKLHQAKKSEYPVKVGFATDVGAGTSFSLLQTAGEGYKVTQLQHQPLSPFQAFFLLTLGGARALSLDDKIGNFDTGKEADFVVLDFRPTPLMQFRNPPQLPPTLDAFSEQLFTLMILGSDRNIRATYILGELACDRQNNPENPLNKSLT